MATARRSTKRDQYTVVLEDIRAQFKVFGERLDGVDERFDRLDGKFEKLETKVDTGFARVDRRFDGVDADLRDHGHQLRLVHGRLDRIETALEKKVDRAEVETMIARRPRSR